MGWGEAHQPRRPIADVLLYDARDVLHDLYRQFGATEEWPASATELSDEINNYLNPLERS